ncbi:MAG: helix-turn-helix domain-containing protein [Deltaproteobacteria bacterium]|jgi:putative transcriptional regulator|nr:helix-turn-helix domain-containing protein [Deltaproteobacteria bacterium]
MSEHRIVKSMKEALAIARGEMPDDAFRVHFPAAQVNVKAIRQGLGLSQTSFANRFGLSLQALRDWELGKRRPGPAASSYLKVIEKAPETVRDALAEGTALLWV